MAILLDYKVNNGIKNMRIDSEILEEAAKTQEKEPVIRLYGWFPQCVSLGRNQSFENINTDYCKKNNIDIVKRITGGRALLHDDEVTYSFVCPKKFLKNGESIISSYKEISSAIIEGFNTIGINLEFGDKKKSKTTHEYCMLLSTGADLCFNGKKIIGSAQYRKQEYILQHGSILLSYDLEKTQKIFNEEYKENYITCINEINNSLKRSDIIYALKEGFKNYFSIAYNQILQYKT